MNTTRQKMQRGRAPCCEKLGLKKGPWAAEEDMRLASYINNFGHGNWRALPKQAGLLRCGKSCRLRWINYLRPDIKRGNFTQKEEETIIRLHGLLGNKWSKIAACLPGRTDNEIKNVWNTHLKKRLLPRESNPSTLESKELSKSSSSSPISSISHCNQGKEVNGDEEQEQAMIKSENMHDPLEEIIQLPLDEPSMDIWDMLDKSKETPSPSCSACSSYITYSNQVDVHVKGVEDQTHPLFKSKSPIDNDSPKGVLEIPVEPDMDFWDMLGDEFCSFSCGGKETHHNAGINEEESTGNVDHRRLIYLENEPLVSCPTYDENIAVQVDPIKYFQTWNFTHVTVGI